MLDAWRSRWQRILAWTRRGEVAAGAHWSRQYRAHAEALAAGSPVYLRRWWQAEPVVRHINARICGTAHTEGHAGFHEGIGTRWGARLPLERVVSVGGGTGGKELHCLARGLFQHVDLYELSHDAVTQGRALAQAHGLQERIRFHLADALTAAPRRHYDAVYWNNALHHMPDTPAAIAWSHDVLRPGGLFLMDDYVGASRFQWSERMLAVNREWWRALPEPYRRDPESNLALPEPRRPDPRALMASDPSEAADSERILPALRRRFPGVEIVLTGGGVYHVGLNDVLHHLLEHGDDTRLAAALALDDQLVAEGETHYAVAWAQRAD
jgi:SAM-dependent methyltransferase